ASADIMADVVTDLTAEEARAKGQAFLRMIAGEASEEDLEELGQAAELESISRMPARVKCAELGWRTLLALLDEAGA
ncbi:MAG: SUF system NifU family Fe-S cluster assembly protein, partial [Eggerthellaceae bacterium]|nr:SUF system NifU family Fe-S cluster assembly protein [Eggerthellaceae bacterium]